MLGIRTLGGLAIENGRFDGSPAARRRPLALLALLAIAGQRGLSREKVVSLLWPESDEERGHNSLSQALSALRRDMATDDLVAGGTELRLNPAAITCDVEEFERCIAAGDLQRAAELYQGPFLDGFFVKGAAEFERWAEEHRRRLHKMYGVVLEKLARQADARGDRADAVDWWRRLATVEPASATSAIGLMNALVASGDRAGALQYYRVHQALLRQELGVETEEPVTTLAARLRHENGNGVSSAPVPPNESLLSLPSSADRGTPPPAATKRDYAAVPKRRSVRWSVLAAVAGVGVIAFIAFRRTDTRPLYNARQVVVTGFVNRTGDAALDAFGFLAADYITDALQRSGLVEVTDPVTSMTTVRGVRDSVAVHDEANEIRLVAEATRAGLVVSGRYSREGDSIVIVARVSDAVQGKLIAATEPVRVMVDAPDDALERVRQRVLGVLAVRLDDRLRDVFTPGSTSPPTLPAYREYVDGLSEFAHSEYAAAVPHFLRAYELDSTFIAPLVWQAFAFGDAGRNVDQQRIVQKLAQQRAQLSSLDRHVLDFLEALVRSDVQSQVTALQQASALAPRSVWTYRLASSLFDTGRFDEALVAFDQIDRKYSWTRNLAQFWLRYIESLHQHGDHQRELDLAREARHAMPGHLSAVHREARALAALGRKAELDQVVAEMRAFPDPYHGLGFFLGAVAVELSSWGDTVNARPLFDSALAWFEEVPRAVAEQSGSRRQFAYMLYHADHWDEARPLFQSFLKENPRDWWALTYLGLCFAHQGERGHAEEIIARLDAAADSTQWFDGWAPVGNVLAAGRIAAALGDRERAIRYMKEVKDRGQVLASRHALSKLSKDFRGLIGYAPYMALTQP